jgi:hypothetical protein
MLNHVHVVLAYYCSQSKMNYIRYKNDIRNSKYKSMLFNLTEFQFNAIRVDTNLYVFSSFIQSRKKRDCWWWLSTIFKLLNNLIMIVGMFQGDEKSRSGRNKTRLETVKRRHNRGGKLIDKLRGRHNWLWRHRLISKRLAPRQTDKLKIRFEELMTLSHIIYFESF